MAPNKFLLSSILSALLLTTLTISANDLYETELIDYENRKATPAELERMQELVREAMREGAIGVGSSLIYAPASFADTDELIALVSAAAEYKGTYISHIRSEGNRLEEGIQELIKISSMSMPNNSDILKASGKLGSNLPFSMPFL